MRKGRDSDLPEDRTERRGEMGENVRQVGNGRKGESQIERVKEERGGGRGTNSKAPTETGK